MITVKNDKGHVLRVTNRAYDVIYKDKGYKPSENAASTDYAEQTAKQLKNVKNDDLKAYLDVKKVEYAANATKEDLITLIHDGDKKE